MVKKRIVSILDINKAEDIVSLDLEGKTSIADYMVIASGRSARHVHTLANRVSEYLKEAELYYIPPEGTENCDWVIVDAGDIVVHIFRPEVRDMYNLEKMWSVALPVTNLEIVS
jgi:ribosome-associated protein